MKDVRLGKYLISFHITKGNTRSDKYFAEYSQHLKVGGVYGKYKQSHGKNDSGLRYPRSVQYFRTAESEGGFHKTQNHWLY